MLTLERRDPAWRRTREETGLVSRELVDDDGGRGELLVLLQQHDRAVGVRGLEERAEDGDDCPEGICNCRTRRPLPGEDFEMTSGNSGGRDGKRGDKAVQLARGAVRDGRENGEDSPKKRSVLEHWKVSVELEEDGELRVVVKKRELLGLLEREGAGMGQRIRRLQKCGDRRRPSVLVDLNGRRPSRLTAVPRNGGRLIADGTELILIQGDVICRIDISWKSRKD